MNNTYKSVEAYAKGRFRLISDTDDIFVFSGFNPSETSGDESPSAAAGMSESVFRFLQRLENKIDHLIGLAQAEKLAADFPFELQAFQVGGNGLLFRTNAPLAPGNKLEIVLFLSSVPLRIAGGIGNVEASVPSPHGPLWKFSFTRLREADLDSIMRFVFQEERQKIREQKLS